MGGSLGSLERLVYVKAAVDELDYFCTGGLCLSPGYVQFLDNRRRRIQYAGKRDQNQTPLGIHAWHTRGPGSTVQGGNQGSNIEYQATAAAFADRVVACFFTNQLSRQPEILFHRIPDRGTGLNNPVGCAATSSSIDSAVDYEQSQAPLISTAQTDQEPTQSWNIRWHIPSQLQYGVNDLPLPRDCFSPFSSVFH